MDQTIEQLNFTGDLPETKAPESKIDRAKTLTSAILRITQYWKRELVCQWMIEGQETFTVTLKLTSCEVHKIISSCSYNGATAKE